MNHVDAIFFHIFIFMKSALVSVPLMQIMMRFKVRKLQIWTYSTTKHGNVINVINAAATGAECDAVVGFNGWCHTYFKGISQRTLGFKMFVVSRRDLSSYSDLEKEDLNVLEA